MKRDEVKEVGFDIAIVSNVPLGGGLSSSASLEVSVSVFLEQILHISVSPEERALLCQSAEHEFAHMPCGIMDQFISSCGVKGNLLLIDCRANQGELVPLNDPSVSIVVCNSNKKHELSGSEYPDRVAQCKKAVEVLQSHYPEIRALRDANLEQIESIREELGDVVYRRASHVVSECDRCIRCKEALLNRDYDKVGQLLLQSHASLRDNFEVSTPELDILVEIASSCEDVYGSRMTGGGFGGCIVCLVKTAGANHLMELLRNEYKKRTGIECSVFLTSPSQGARILSPYEVDEVSPCCCSSSSGKCPMKRIVKNPLFWVVSGTVAVGSALFLLRRRNN